MIMEANMNQIPVTFENLFTCDCLAQAVLPALPTAGDDVYVRSLGYEVVNCEWTLQADGTVEIVIVVRPQMDASGHYPFSYEEEEA